MFSEPLALPTGLVGSFMHWTYELKMCGTKKARMVCDGVRNRSAQTMGHTYANFLVAPSECLFWAMVAKMGLIAVGADVSNAFAEALPVTIQYVRPTAHTKLPYRVLESSCVDSKGTYLISYGPIYFVNVFIFYFNYNQQLSIS